MLFKYNGKKEEFTAFGFDFSDGKTVEVASDNPFARKFVGNRFFDCVDDKGNILNAYIDDKTNEIVIDGELEEKVKKKEPEKPSKKIGVFRVKQDGSPYSAPDKIFTGPDALEDARQWMEENNLNPDEHVIAEK